MYMSYVLDFKEFDRRKYISHFELMLNIVRILIAAQKAHLGDIVPSVQIVFESFCILHSSYLIAFLDIWGNWN